MWNRRNERFRVVWLVIVVRSGAVTIQCSERIGGQAFSSGAVGHDSHERNGRAAVTGQGIKKPLVRGYPQSTLQLLPMVQPQAFRSHCPMIVF